MKILIFVIGIVLVTCLVAFIIGYIHGLVDSLLVY